jgi:hypothetical protein
MFKNSGPSTSLDCSLKGAQDAAFSQAHSVMPNNTGNSSALSVPLYNSGSVSSCTDAANAKGGNGQLVAMAHGANPAAWQNQVTSFVSQYSVDCSGYGGSVDSAGYGGEVVVTGKHFNQGIGNGMEGGDPGKSQPHGGSNDEGGRTPGQKWIPKIFSGLGF